MSNRLFGISVVRLFCISVFRKSNIEHRTSVIRLPVCLWRVRGLMVRGLEVRRLGSLVFRLFGSLVIRLPVRLLEGSRFIGSRFGSLCALGGFEV
jgi:hypothetical protein